ncbi:hypothetical protein LEP1GSC088_0841 [Leptospira interrogans str. L1207]|nr:hypothetical protein LEP1GSC088_0841 [Leptospira interrogans str. L1207]
MPGLFCYLSGESVPQKLWNSSTVELNDSLIEIADAEKILVRKGFRLQLVYLLSNFIFF